MNSTIPRSPLSMRLNRRRNLTSSRALTPAHACSSVQSANLIRCRVRHSKDLPLNLSHISPISAEVQHRDDLSYAERFLITKSHCTFVKVPAPDSAWQVPDTIELSVRVLPSLSLVPLKTMEPSVPPSPFNSKFIPDSVPATFIECRHAELVKVAVPDSWPLSPLRLRASRIGSRSAACMGPMK